MSRIVRTNLSAFIGLIGFCLLLLLGYAYPELMWGCNFFAHLPTFWAAIIILFGVSALIHEMLEKPSFNEVDHLLLWSQLKLVLPLLLGAFVNGTPMVKDVYGDSFSIIPHFSVAITEWDWQMTKELLSYNLLNPKIGEQSFYSVNLLLSYLTGALPIEAMKYLEVGCAMLFIYFWMSIIEMTVSDFRARLAMSLAGALAPLTLVFHNHAEMYVVSFTTAIAFFFLLTKFHFRGKSSGHLFLLILVYLFSIKFHIFNILLGLAFVPMFYPKLKEKWKPFSRVSNANLTTALISGGVLLTAIIYVFVTDSVNGTRLFTATNLYDAVFLPIRSKEGPPLDRYDLFSINHILDFMNMAFLWGPVFGFLLLSQGKNVLQSIRDSDYYQSVLLVFSALFILFFLLNPLLAMPTDWDLFSFPAISLMILSTAAFSRAELPQLKLTTASTIAISIVSASFLAIHFRAESLSERLETMGMHEFKTYWAGSSTSFEHAYQLVDNDEERLQKRQQTLQALEPFSIKDTAVDIEYAELLRATGELCKKMGRGNLALSYHLRSFNCEPTLKKNVLDLVVIYFEREEYAKAIPYLDRLVAYRYPNQKKACLIAIHTCLEAGELNLARKYYSYVISIFPDDPFLQRIGERLLSEKPKTSLELFIKAQ